MKPKPPKMHKTVFADADGRAPEYWECPACGFLSGDPALRDPSTPCPGCGATGAERRRFPSDRVRRLDERIRQYNRDGDYEIVVILVMTLLETILEDILDRMRRGTRRGSARAADDHGQPTCDRGAHR